MNRQLSAAERCYLTIFDKIIKLEFKPNEAIGEHALADSLGVSRTPVREALSRLNNDGLVDLRSRRGVIVSPIRYEAVKTAQFVREKLEVAIIEAAVESNSQRGKLLIRQAIEEQELAMHENNADLFFEADERMHQLYCELADWRGVWPIIADSKKHLDRVRRLAMKDTPFDTLLSEHRELYRAVESKNTDLARAIIEHHLRRVVSVFDEIADRFPDYFDIGENLPELRSANG